MSFIPQVFCLMGPTASGKTDLAMKIAAQIPCEIISVDSVMVYRGMDIGTAKPSIEERQGIPHHLIDICDPIQVYSAAQFCEDALRIIDEIIARQHYPLLVGGTMLYYKSLLQGLSPLPSADLEIRKQLESEADIIGWHGLHEQLKKIDPQAAKNIKPQDQQRIQRALEVHAITGKTLTELWQIPSSSKLSYPVKNIALIPNDRHVLHNKIAQRFIAMLEGGLIEEVRKLKQREDLNKDLPAVRSVGYRQVWQYLEGEFDKKQMQHKAIVATRQYAKRQLTWLRSWPDLESFSSDSPELFDNIMSYLQKPSQ